MIWDTLNTYLISCLMCYLVTLMRDTDRVMAEGLNTQNPGAPQVLFLPHLPMKKPEEPSLWFQSSFSCLRAF